MENAKDVRNPVTSVLLRVNDRMIVEKEDEE